MATNERARATVDIDGQAAEQQLNELSEAAKKLRKDLRDMAKADKVDLDAYKAKEKQLKEVTKQQRQLKKSTFDVNRVMKDLNKTSMNDLIKAERELRREMKKVGGQTKEEIKRQEQLAKQYQKVDRAIKDKKKSLFGAKKGVNGVVSSAKGLLPAFGFAAIIAGIGRLVSGWARWQSQLEKSRHLIRTLTDATESELDSLTAKVQATSKVFNKDFNEVATAANVLSKQMNVSFGRSMELIQDGFSAGADSSGEFLSMLKEYPTQLKQIGLNAEQSIALMTQQVKEGVFSDKGIDAIKEAGIRLREMTKPTQDAIEGIGLTVDQVQKVIGEEGIIGGIKMVSQRMNQLEEDSPAVGAAMADIFAGPGEDAGLKYLKTLKDIDVTMDGVMDDTDEYSKAQRRLVEANESVSESLNAIFGEGSWWTKVKAGWKEFWANTFNDLRQFSVWINQVKKGMGLNYKDYSEFRDVIFQTVPSIKKLVEKVKEHGTETEKGKEALTELNSVLVETYGSEGLKLAQEFTEEQQKLARERIKQRKKEAKEAEKDNEKTKKSFKELEESLETEYAQRTLALKQQLAEQKISQEQYQDEMWVEELSYLAAKKGLYEKMGKDTLQIEEQIADKQIEINEKVTSVTVENGKKLAEQLKTDIQNIEADLAAWEAEQFEDQRQRLQRRQEMMNAIMSQGYVKALIDLKKAQERKLITMEQHEKAVRELNEAEARSWAMSGAAAVEGAETTEQAAAGVLNSIRDQIKAYLAEALAGVLAKTLASVPFPFNIAVATAAAGAASFLFDKIVPPVPQKASGNLDVIGEDDGRLYSNVPYQGTLQGVGIANGGQPTLINEQGGEIFIDRDTSRNIQLKAPELIEEIKTYQVPQRAEGNLPAQKSDSNLQRTLQETNENNRRMAGFIQRLVEQGVSVNWGYRDSRNVNDQIGDMKRIKDDIG